MQEGAPKSLAGVRNVVLPGFLVTELAAHIDTYAAEGPEGLIFRGAKGAMLRRSNLSRAASWPEIVRAAGLPVGFHFMICGTPAVNSLQTPVRPRES
jgi:hypothetical protein